MGYESEGVLIRSIIIATISHYRQRYNTVGDWQINGETLNVHVSDLGDWRMNACVAVHETVEALQCVQDGVNEEAVTRFDILYEQRRESRTSNDDLWKEFQCDCIPDDRSEPGEDEHAPYALQHANADLIERILARALGLNWNAYNEKVESL